MAAITPNNMHEDSEVIGKIESIETIAVGPSIRELHRLRKAFGRGRWRKLKGHCDGAS